MVFMKCEYGFFGHTLRRRLHRRSFIFRYFKRKNLDHNFTHQQENFHSFCKLTIDSTLFNNQGFEVNLNMCLVGAFLRTPLILWASEMAVKSTARRFNIELPPLPVFHTNFFMGSSLYLLRIFSKLLSLLINQAT